MKRLMGKASIGLLLVVVAALVVCVCRLPEAGGRTDQQDL